MKLKHLHFVVTLLLLAALVWLLATKECSAPISNDDAELQEEHEVELAIYMGRMQRYCDKLWWAGQAKNEEMVDFYLHELEEAMETIEHANVIEEDGVAISELIKHYGLDAVERMEQVALDSSSFSEGYLQLVDNCNGCHTAAKYPFIKIKVPTTPTFTGQEF